MKQTILFQQLFFLISLIAVGAMFYHAEWYWWVAGFLYYKFFVGLVGNQIAQHRYFSHRSFETSRIKHYFLYFSSLTTGINPVYYANAHRHHHLHSDQPTDIHSPHISFKHVFSPFYGAHSGIDYVHVSAILDQPLRKINRYWAWIFIGSVVAVGLLNWKFACYVILPAVFWNYVHMIVFRVWLAHWKTPGSYQNFDNGDHSWNNQWIHWFDLGEGLHNNHHRYPNRYDQAVESGEFDLAGFVVRKLFV
jgi:stearoyl-CoA desaturase (delta-9 desaturase)